MGLDTVNYAVTPITVLLSFVVGLLYKDRETRLHATELIQKYRTDVQIWGFEGIKLFDDLVRLGCDDPKRLENGKFRKDLFDNRSNISTHIDTECSLKLCMMGRSQMPHDLVGRCPALTWVQSPAVSAP